MSITVEFKDYNEMLAFARVLLAGPAAPVTASVKETVKQEVLPSESETSMSNEPAGVDLPIDGPTYTLEEVRAKLTELSRVGKQKEVKGILDFFQAKNVTTLDPKDYAAVMEKAGAL